MREDKILIHHGTDSNYSSHTFGRNQMLKRALKLAGFNPDNVRISTQALQKEHAKHEWNIIVVVGDCEYLELCDIPKVEKSRGSLYMVNNPLGLPGKQKIMPVQDPHWIRSGNIQAFWYLVTDLTRAARNSDYPGIRLPKWQSITGPTAQEAVDFLDAVPYSERWSFDIETRANHLACYSVAWGDKAMCIPVQNPDGAAFTPEYEASIMRALARLMARNPNLVGQNLAFDLDYMFDYQLEPSGVWMDTMLSHPILYPEFPKGLGFLVSLYTDMPYHKDEGSIHNSKVTTQDLWDYNNKDTITTLWCATEIEKQLRDRSLWPVHQRVTEYLSLGLEMQRMGIEVDEAKKLQLQGWLDEEEQALNAAWTEDPTLVALAGDTKRTRPNVNSPKQMAKFLYEDLKLPKKTRMGAVVCDEQAIEELKARNPNIPELDWVLRERHLRKLRSSYLNAVTDEQ